MDSVVIVLLVAIGFLVAMAVLALAALIALGRRNRVVGGVRSPTPLGWMVSTRREAILHRRLRAVGRRLELLPATEGLTDVVVRLQTELVDLDAHLVTVSRRPTAARRVDRREMADRVTEIEDLARRVEERSRSGAMSLPEIAERLDMLEAADEELRGLEPG